MLQEAELPGAALTSDTRGCFLHIDFLAKLWL